jgi:hypothetical protein
MPLWRMIKDAVVALADTQSSIGGEHSLKNWRTSNEETPSKSRKAAQGELLLCSNMLLTNNRAQRLHVLLNAVAQAFG